MNYEFKLTGYCESCECADLEAKVSTLYAGDVPLITSVTMTCKHQSACARMARIMEA
jgi:hypothetical protein